MDNSDSNNDNGILPEDDLDIERESIERLARILHESMIYRDDVPVKPFAEWDELHEPAKEGRRMMARYIRAHSDKVSECLSPVKV